MFGVDDATWNQGFTCGRLAAGPAVQKSRIGDLGSVGFGRRSGQLDITWNRFVCIEGAVSNLGAPFRRSLHTESSSSNFPRLNDEAFPL
jgi:hypothetical protein